jgi:FkbM family methyltransferase
LLKKIDTGDVPPTRRLVGAITTFAFRGQQVSFFVTDENDIIQQQHVRGGFYEEDELNVMARHFPRGGVFVDVGANVGNHTVFVSRFLFPRQTIAFEANPAAVPILETNIALNHLHDRVDTALLGVGLADGWTHADVVAAPNNLGGARLRLATDRGGTRVAPGDSLLSGRRIDFLKIDVEGMEIAVLRGLGQTISLHRPRIFVEVDNPNGEEFYRWACANRYECAYTTKKQHWSLPPLSSSGYENFLVVPVERL